MSKRVLLTGATGFIGHHCIEPLKARGFEVHAVSSKPMKSGAGGVHWHQANLLEPGAAKAEGIRVSLPAASRGLALENLVTGERCALAADGSQVFHDAASGGYRRNGKRRSRPP